MKGEINVPTTLVAKQAGEWKQIGGPKVNLRVALDQLSMSFTPSVNGDYKFQRGNEVFEVQVGEVVPEPQPTPTPEPTPQPSPTGLLYDSNVDIDWSKGDQKITDVYGTFKPNGKYFRMKASGKPRIYLIAATKELILEHDGDYGRAYFGVCNYQSRFECEFKLESCSHNASFKTRNRHQYGDIVSGAPDKQRQGGMGNAWHCDSVENDLEIVHGTGGEGGASKSFSPKLEPNKWYKIKFSQTDNNGKIHIKDELDRGDGQGYKVINEDDVPAPSQFFNKAEFEAWSEFWIRLNAKGGGKLGIRNIKMYKL